MERKREGSIIQKLKRKSYRNGRKTKKQNCKIKIVFLFDFMYHKWSLHEFLYDIKIYVNKQLIIDPRL